MHVMNKWRPNLTLPPSDFYGKEQKRFSSQKDPIFTLNGLKMEAKRFIVE